MRILFALALAWGALWTAPASAQLLIPEATGHDLDFQPVASVEVDLSLAATGTWDSTSHVAGTGVYDPDKWVVVFKYKSVNIPAGVTVTFKNHPSRAPVIWLVGGPDAGDGTVQIDGTVDLDGENTVDAPDLPEPGPGGFRGGKGIGLGEGRGSGFGPGGGRPSVSTEGNGNGFGTGAGHAGAGDNGSQTGGIAYGNPSLIPLVGGSGGGAAGYAGVADNPGGAGGGAILIAATDSVTVNGTITADGGTPTFHAGGGSGGGIRVVCDSLSGTGTLQALGGTPPIQGANGRIRLEASTATGSLTITPLSAVVDPIPVIIVPGAADPAARIVSIAGVPVPSDPTAHVNFPGADVSYNADTSVDVVIETTNVETNSTVTLRVAGRASDEVVVTASHTSGDTALSTWTASVDTATGFGVMQVRVVRPTP